MVPPGRFRAEAGMVLAKRRHDLIRTKALHVGHRPGGKLVGNSGLFDKLAEILFVFVAEDVAGDLHDR